MAKGKILIAPQDEEVEGPLVFLAGPIIDAEDWQSKAIEIIHKLRPDINIASPRRPVFDAGFVYNEQVDWETAYLNRAAKDGVILFWLSKEFKHDPNVSYAQSTRFELAEWKVKHERDGAKIALGIEEGFTGAEYIRCRFNENCPDIAIMDSLQKTCEKAVSLLAG